MNKIQEEIILQQRAKELAKKPETPVVGDQTEVIRFQLHPEVYAIATDWVQEVITMDSLTPIPGTPAFIMGIVNYRGTILSVVNLKRFLGIAETGLTQMNKIIVLRDKQMEFGLVVDKILNIESVNSASISAPPIAMSENGTAIIKGMIGNDTILINDVKLLHNNKMRLA